MANLGMTGPYELTKENIDNNVTRTSAGNYALTNSVVNGKFVVEYVGRSDSDVNARLKTWVGKYKHFKFTYASSPMNAFERECRNYHEFGESKSLNNSIHPDRPENTNWKCPLCDLY